MLSVHCGEEGVQACLAGAPDLVILDIRLPDIDGFEVARRLRSTRKIQGIPIIFLAERRERLDRLRGLEMRREDYVTKPFDIQELRLKVRNALVRARCGSQTNAVTGLPEGALVDDRLRLCLKQDGWSVLVISLVNLVNFREAYGFVAEDDLLRAVAAMLQAAFGEPGGAGHFLGQLTASDFIVICRTGPAVDDLKERIQKRLEQSFDYFYRDQDRTTQAFKNQRLGLRIGEVIDLQDRARELDQLKLQIEQLYRQGLH